MTVFSDRATAQAIAANRRERASGEKAMAEGLDAAILGHNADPLAHPGLGGGGGGAVIPVYTGDIPPLLVYDIDGSPVYVEL
jgi:hypothetical protein